ncbi:MAG: hypothetical protein ACOY3E_02140 [Pseudomonadota bacterium]
MTKLKTGIGMLAAAMLAACASGPFARSSEPHGIVDLDIPRQAHRQYEAFFLAVDGQNVVPERKQLLLRPGQHTIRLGAKLENLYSADAISRPGSRASERSSITIDVKEGMRYSVAAKLDGPYTDDWQAIVSREAPLQGYAKR